MSQLSWVNRMSFSSFLVAGVCLSSCHSTVSNGGGNPKASSPSPVLARVGSGVITQADMDREIAREPAPARARYATEPARKQLLEGMVRFEVMAQAAAAEGWLQDPDVIHSSRQLAINKFIQKEIGARTSAESVLPAHVKAYYDAHRDDQFSIPPASHVRHIRVTDAATAARVAMAARKLRPADDVGFAALCQSHSEDELTKNSGGDLGFIDKNSPYPKAVVQAALAMVQPGEIGGPISAEDGFHILRLVARRAPVVQSLADAEEAIRQQLLRERRTAELDALIARVLAQAKIERTSSPVGTDKPLTH